MCTLVVVEEVVEEEVVVEHKLEQELDRSSYSGGDRLVVVVEQVELDNRVVQVVQVALLDQGLQDLLVVLVVLLALALLDLLEVPLLQVDLVVQA